ncbi:MAG: MFS transporter [Dehalococcoidales bacterium]|nr:MFS transporter [Dehalococcoidales bacterium]
MKRDSDRDREIGIKPDIGVEPAIDEGGLSLHNLKTFTSLKNPVYRLYFLGMLGQRASMNMQMMTRSLLIFRITGSAAILGMTSLFNAVPQLALSLFGGVIADRVQKKYVLLAGLASSAVVSLGVALALTLGYLSVERSGSWWILAVASLFQGSIMGLMIPSRQAIIPEIVNEEQIMNAISLDALGMNTLRIMAPALSGFLIDAIGFKAVYFTMTGMYLIGLVFIALMPLTSTMTIRGSGAFAEIKEGFHYLRQESSLLIILAFSLFTVVLSMPYMLLLPVFTEDVLKVSASGLGVLISASGAGALVGSLVLASLPNRKRGFMLLASSLTLGLALAGFSFSSSWSLSLALIVFVGLGQAGRMSLSNTLLQSYSEEEYRGRIMSIYMMQFGLQSFSSFAAGLLAEGVGIQWAIGGFAMVLVFLCIMALFFVPRLRKLD